MRKTIVASFIAGAGIVGLAWTARAADDPTVRKAVLATVRIITGTVDQQGDFSGAGSGSGVILSPDGLILTARHVVMRSDGTPHSQVWAGLVDPDGLYLPPNRAVKLKVVRTDEAKDLALLQPARGGSAPGSYPHLRVSGRPGLDYGSRITLIGFPVASGPTATVLDRTVVALDDLDGWVRVDGGFQLGASGGPAINEAGELVGIANQVLTDTEIPFLGDEDVPIGVVTLGSVGMLRSAAVIREFLGQTPGLQPSEPVEPAGVQVTGAVLEQKTRKPIPGVVIGVLSPDTSAPETTVRRRDLVAYAKTNFQGEFKVNRLVAPGPYLIKVVHPQYRTVIETVDIKASNRDFEIQLKKEE